MSTALTFGDVVRLDGKDLIFLGLTTEIIYLAKMLDLEGSRQFVAVRDSVFKSTPKAAKASNNQLYCFIELETSEFKNRIAHYGIREDKSEYILEDFLDKIGSLNSKDKSLLKKEILDDGALPEDLKNVVKSVATE